MAAADRDRREERRRPQPSSSLRPGGEEADGPVVVPTAAAAMAAAAPAAAAAGAAAAAEQEGGERLADRLTVIVTTSPVRSNPDTYIIRRVFASFRLVPGLDTCRKLVVCDGFQVAAPGVAPKYKKGKITQGEVGQYSAYIQSLRDLAAGPNGQAPGFQRTEVHPLPERHGFAGAVQYGCSLATTPYVLVVQHDRLFVAGVDLQPPLAAMDLHPDIRYVGLRTAKTRHVTRDTVDKGPVRLRRLWFWYDSTHLCRTDLYRGLFHWRFAHYLLPGSTEAARSSMDGSFLSSSSCSAGSTSSDDNEEEEEEDEEERRLWRWQEQERMAALRGEEGGRVAEEVMGVLTFGSRFPQWAKVKRLQAPVLKKGFFIEDTFGQLMLTHLQTLHRKEGLAAANAVHERRYGAYTLVVPIHSDDSDPETTPAAAPVTDAATRRGQKLAATQGQGLIYEGPRWVAGGQAEIVEEEVVAHLDGRDYLTRAQLTAKGLEPWARKGDRPLKPRATRLAEADAQLQQAAERRRKDEEVVERSLLAEGEGEGLLACLRLGLEDEEEEGQQEAGLDPGVAIAVAVAGAAASSSSASCTIG